MNNRIFIWIVGIAALFIAGNAALFSVTGLGQLFSNSMLAVIVMASSLEIGKLVAASYLHRYWDYTSIWIKSYLIIAIISLMIITSAGIFGYLSNAYEQTSISLETQQRQIELLESKKNLLGQDIPDWRNRITSLTELRNKQETRIDTLIQKKYFLSLRNTEEFIRNADAEIIDLRNKISVRTDSIGSLEIQILEQKNKESEQARDIGGFRFVAKTFDIKIDVVVKWFMFLLIFVFDPLAIVLILSWQTALEKQRKEKLVPDRIYKHGENIILKPPTGGSVKIDPFPKSEMIDIKKDDETDYLMKNDSNKKHILKSIKQANEIELINEDIPVDDIEETISAMDEASKKLMSERPTTKYKMIKQDPVSDIKKDEWKSSSFDWGNKSRWQHIPEAVEYYKKFIV